MAMAAAAELVPLPLAESNCYSCRFLLSNKLLWWPDKWRTNSCNVSKYSVQKQHVYRPPDSGELIIFRCTEHKCFKRWAFCLNMATQSRHANGFSPVCTRRCVFKFHDMPNCLPQYSQRYSRTGALPLAADVLLLLECCCWPAECGVKSLALSEFDTACRPVWRLSSSAGAPAKLRAPAGGQLYINGATANWLSALGGRRRLLLWWLLACSRSVVRWDPGDDGGRSPAIKSFMEKEKFLIN